MSLPYVFIEEALLFTDLMLLCRFDLSTRFSGPFFPERGDKEELRRLYIRKSLLPGEKGPGARPVERFSD
jgi:hypothetical protein